MTLKFLLLCVAVTVVTAEDRPVTSTKLGALRGVWQRSESGRQYAAYMGIPFARPPIGELRFQPPVPVEPWDGEWDAGYVAPSCMAYSHLLGAADTEIIKGQEDCLYLNVFTPKTPSKAGQTENKLPVLVFIHGGAFMFGGSEFYGAKYLMNRELVVVTINYRLGPLGFISLEDDVQPGNNGMRDQVTALQWVRDHIAAFGGDKDRVTLLGNSAGGASVHYHYLSPLSKGLFKGGISLSGSALCRWALADSAREKAHRLAHSLGCPTIHGSQRLMDCLRSRPAEHILLQVAQFQVWQYSPFSPFGPVVEHLDQTLPPFLPEAPAQALLRGHFLRAPWVTGITTAEGLYPVASFVASESELDLLDRDFSRLVPHLLDFNMTVTSEARRRDVCARIRAEYFGSQPISAATVPQVIKMTSDRLFVVDAQRAAELHAVHSPVYFYQFDFRGNHSLTELMSDTTQDFGVSHADDMMYILNTTYLVDEARVGMAKRVENLMLDFWESFSANGVPESKEAPMWEPVKPGNELEFLHVRTVPPVMSHAADLGNAAFWESLPFRESEQNLAHSVNAREEL